MSEGRSFDSVRLAPHYAQDEQGLLWVGERKMPYATAGGTSALPWRVVSQFWQMSHTITIRLTEELAAWLRETARRTGLPVGRIIRQQLESAKAQGGSQRFLRHAGALRGPSDLSSRKGFTRR